MTRSDGDQHSAPTPSPAVDAGTDAQVGSAGRGALLVTTGILASRLVGLVRQRVLAHYLGTSDAADAVTAAFRVGNITQNLLGEGTLSAAFVPVYAKTRIEDPGRAIRFARAALGALLTLAIGVSALGALLSPLLAGVIAAGFEGSKLALTAELLRILFPMTGLLVVGAWALGVLTAHRRFLVPYLAPVVWSLAQIAALLIAGVALGMGDEDLARAVAWGALAGAALQLVIMLLPVRRILGSVMPSFDLRAPGLATSASRFPGAIAGRGIIQISALVDTFIVSFLGPGANATFGYAQTAYLLPMAVLGTGEAAAALPGLAEQDASSPEARRKVIDGLRPALTRVFALALGATAFFLALGTEVTTLLFQGGSFDAASTAAVAAALSAYALGLPANAASRILSSAAFASGDTRRPAVFALVRVVVSTVASVALMGRLGVPGVVLGATIAAWVELSLLAHGTHRTFGSTGLAQLPWARLIACGAVPAIVGLATRFFLKGATLHPLIASSIILGVAGVAFLAAAEALRLVSIRSILRRRRS